jgi:FkbM family methyltransferase
MSDDNAGYRFWTQVTAAQARNTGFPIAKVKRRFNRSFQAICRLVEPTVTVELGAHEASFSKWAARTFPDARCLALEANPHVYAKFRERLHSRRVDYRHLAAASENGPITLHIPRQLLVDAKGPANKMGSLALHRHDREHDSVEVEAVRVDDLLQLGEHDRVAAWIDVEGASEQVLTGARGVLERTAAVQIEVEREAFWPGQWLDTDVHRFFRSIGKIPVLRDLQFEHQYNVLYLDPDLCARSEVVESLAAVMRPPRQPAEPNSQDRPAPARGRRGWRRLRNR